MSNETFYRYAIKRISNDGTQVHWVAIGTGLTEDETKAHLYTSKKLAEDKMDAEVKANRCIEGVFYELVQVKCQMLNVVRSASTDWLGEE